MKMSLSQIYPKEVVGLVTIKPKSNTSYFKKEFTPFLLTVFFTRRGSNTMPLEGEIDKKHKTQKP
jgi:hypothetical protein